jgi:phosphoserine phosphatase
MESQIKLVCFDLDKTLIKQTSWYELNMALGITHEEDQQMLDDYEAGKFSYEEWMKKIYDLYKLRGKANLKNVTDAISRSYTFKDGAKEIISYLKERGYKVVLISGSIDILIDMVAKDLDLDMAEATHELIFDENDQLQEIRLLAADNVAKLHHLESFCRKLGLDLNQCACIGDGDNDLDMFRKTGRGITFKGSKIEKEAWKVIESLSDLKSILI